MIRAVWRAFRRFHPTTGDGGDSAARAAQAAPAKCDGHGWRGISLSRVSLESHRRRHHPKWRRDDSLLALPCARSQHRPAASYQRIADRRFRHTTQADRLWQAPLPRPTEAHTAAKHRYPCPGKSRRKSRPSARSQDPRCGYRCANICMGKAHPDRARFALLFHSFQAAQTAVRPLQISAPATINLREILRSILACCAPRQYPRSAVGTCRLLPNHARSQPKTHGPNANDHWDWEQIA